MKSIVLSLLLLVSSTSLFGQYLAIPPDVPATAPNPDFPLHVHIFGNHWNARLGVYDGWGRGDLLGDKTTGFDYTYSCGEPFLHNAQRDEFYQARWKKQDHKLEILMQKVGSDHLQKCELNVTLKPLPYGRYVSPTASAATETEGSAPTASPATAEPKVQ